MGLNMSSRLIKSNQEQVYPGLSHLVLKRKNNLFEKPFALHTLNSFDIFLKKIESEKRRFILDSGCGTGDSSLYLSSIFKEELVVAIDKSAERIRKARGNSNILYLQADCIDFWRLLLKNSFFPDKHYLFFPNPWPKKKHLGRRWYGHPVFSTLMQISGHLHCRSNWPLYIEEFKEAIRTLKTHHVSQSRYRPKNCITGFEKKYYASGHELFYFTALKKKLYEASS